MSTGYDFSPCSGSCTTNTWDTDGCHDRFGTCESSPSCHCGATGTVGKGKLAVSLHHGDSFIFSVSPTSGFAGDSSSNNSITVVYP